MSTLSKITELQNKINRAEEYLIPLRTLASTLREEVRKSEELFTYTNQQESPMHEIVVEGISLKMSSLELLSIVNAEIEKVLRPLENERKLLSDIENLIKDK